MNKSELIEALADKHEISKAEAGRVVETLLELIAKHIKKDEQVALAGFGTFRLKERKAREGVKPGTKEKMIYKASKTVAFKPATALKDAL